MGATDTSSADERADAAVSKWRGYAGNEHDDPPLVRKLDYITGDNISTDIESLDDELVEGVLGRNTLAVIYGDSNSGKTFLAIDMAASVAEGGAWLGRRVVGGIVLYLASEGPGSVQMRVKAYKARFGKVLQNLVIVRSPINLFDGDADVLAVLALVAQVEAQLGDKVVLIIGDTLARLSAGANENAGADMGVVLKNADCIRVSTLAAFLLIHHTGKDAAKGMRGWSGMRAAIDTEVEVTEDAASGTRTAEVTKQRDLPGKGTRIGFRLEVEPVGRNRWGELRTSCVVVPADSPPKTGKALGEVAGAIMEFMNARKPAGCKRKVLVEHFDGRYDRSSVYRGVVTLLDGGYLYDVAGVLSLSQKA